MTSDTKKLEPSKNVGKLVKAMLVGGWRQREAEERKQKRKLENQLQILAIEKNEFLDRLVETENLSIAEAYEVRTEAIQTQELLLSEKLGQNTQNADDFDEKFELTMNFISSRYDI